MYYNLAPDSCNNMNLFSDVASDCRIGSGDLRPFSGITCVCDFCAHSHKDSNNMVGGATAVVTLLRPEDRHDGHKDDEQFHVLPLYVPDCTKTELDKKVASGGVQVFNKFTRTIAVRETKKANCKRGRRPAERKRMASFPRTTQETREHSAILHSVLQACPSLTVPLVSTPPEVLKKISPRLILASTVPLTCLETTVCWPASNLLTPIWL